MALLSCFRQPLLGGAILVDFPVEWRKLSDTTCLADFTETEDAYHIKADTPGMDKSDIKIELKGNQLTLEGERKEESRQEEEQGITHCERSHKTFRRVLHLPKNAKVENTKASLDRGVLSLTIPKKTVEEEAQNVRKIDIN